MKKTLISILVASLAAALFCSQAGAQTKYNDIFEMIRGRVPGVTVGQASAGQMPSIVIRGVGTNSGMTQPLFIVDGIQTDNIASINPDDVDEIDIIKDGTSAIYGSGRQRRDYHHDEDRRQAGGGSGRGRQGRQGGKESREESCEEKDGVALQLHLDLMDARFVWNTDRDSFILSVGIGDSDDILRVAELPPDGEALP